MKSKGRYEILEILGEGGMGIVYRALDPVMKRQVTVKTIKDPQDKAVLELFKRECDVLASMTHPNIVEIYDIGEADEGGIKRPYFVMPLLPGVTLQELIRTSSPRLTVEHSIEMISQVCRGLWAAHESGLVHRDLKPSNLFVSPDDSVRIIDFGMAHLTNQHSATGMKGTIPYMAPEQIQMKQKPTPLSDQFSLAVVSYEMLARRHPFSGVGHEDVAQAIIHFTPPPISEFNPSVSPAISQVIHKALAKDPFHRFPDIRNFSECLQKALRGEAIDIFDPARIAPRLQQARKAFDSGDLDDASEIVMELEAENYLAPEIGELRKQIEEIRRAKTVKQLLETAKRRFDEGEYPRSLQKLQEVLNIDPTNTDAFTLKGAIEGKRSATQIEEWFRLASEHMENHAYGHARQALQKVLDLRPKEIRAQTRLAEVDRCEQEHVRLRAEKDRLYKSAIEAVQRGDVNSAVHKMERVLDLDRRAPYSTSPDQGPIYQKFYEEIRSRRDHLASQESDSRRHLSEGNFTTAADICEAVLANYPNNVVFGALRDDIEQARRLEISAYLAKIERDVAAEPDLNRKTSILEEARKKYPSEERFEQSLRAVRTRRDAVDLIAGRARTFEEHRQFSDALSQWETLRNIYPKYPGLDIEIDRLKKRREQQVSADVKSLWVTQVDQALAVHNYVRAVSLAADGLAEFPDDDELVALVKQVQQAQNRAEEAQAKANSGKALHEAGNTAGALDLLRDAYQLDAHNPMVRTGLIDVLLKEAGRKADSDWRTAEPFVQEALDLDPNNPLAKSISTLMQDKRQAEDVSAALSRARELQASGDIKAAFAEVDAVRDKYPREQRLILYRASLQESLSAKDKVELRTRDLEQVMRLAQESEATTDVKALESIFQKSNVYSKYGSDSAFRQPLSVIQDRLRQCETVRFEAQVPDRLDAKRLWNGWAAVAAKYMAVAAKYMEGSAIRTHWIAICVGAGLFLFVAAGLIVFWPRDGGRNGGTVETPKVTIITVEGALPGEYMVFDDRKNDVTAKVSLGLGRGSYRLSGSRSGFQPVELPINVDPEKEARKTVEVQWHPWLPELRLTVKDAAGTLKMDDVDVELDRSGILKAFWKNGPHKLVWNASGGASVEARFQVSDTGIEIEDPVVRNAVGIAVAVRGSEANYKGINTGTLTKVMDGQSSPVPGVGSFGLAAGQKVQFQVKSGGFPLGEVQADPQGKPTVSVYLAAAPKRFPERGQEYGLGETAAQKAARLQAEAEAARLKAEAARLKAEEDQAVKEYQKENLKSKNSGTK